MRDAQRVVIAIHGCGEVGKGLSGVTDWPTGNQLVAQRGPRQITRDVNAERDHGECEEDERCFAREGKKAQEGAGGRFASRNTTSAIDCRASHCHKQY